MAWVKRKKDEHVCSRPGFRNDIEIGDIWQCDVCHVQWEVKGFDSGMQWDPFPTVIKWARYFDNQHGIYAPGSR